MLGDTVRAARQQRGWTQEELAKEARVSRKHISSLEREVANVSVGVLAKVARALTLHEIHLEGFILRASTDAITAEIRNRIEQALSNLVIAKKLMRTGDAEPVGETLRREAPLAVADRPLSNLIPFPDQRIRITSLEERQNDELKTAIATSKQSEVEWRTSYRADPEKHVVTRRGKAAAGFGSLEEESEDEKQRQIPEHYWNDLGARNAIILRGDSLVDLGYVDHDLLFVRPTAGSEPRNNDVIVCRLDGEVLAKVYAIEGQRRWMLSANEREKKKYPPRSIGEDFEIYGVVVGRSGYGLSGRFAPRPARRGK